jgi:hypothetical protein
MARCLDVSLAAVAILISASGAMSQGARARANALENDAANGVKPFAEYSAQPRIIWRSPEGLPPYMGGATRLRPLLSVPSSVTNLR